MKKLKYTSCEVTDLFGKQRIFEYFFLVEEIETPRLFLEHYGVSVEEPQGDCKMMAGISTNFQRVEELMCLLVKNKVSPTTCEDVLADWLS